MFENRRVNSKTAEIYGKAFGKEAENKYVEGVMLYNRLMQQGIDDPYVQVLGEHLDRMDKLVATERALDEMLSDCLRSLKTKMRSAEERHAV